MFEDMQELAENSAYLKAVEEKDISLEMLHQLPPVTECKELEIKLKEDNKITFNHIFHEPTGFYLLKCFLISDYGVDRAIFIKDCEAYRAMRFENVRRRVAKLLYQRFVAFRDLTLESEFPKGSSVFEIIKEEREKEKKEEKKNGTSGKLSTSEIMPPTSRKSKSTREVSKSLAKRHLSTSTRVREDSVESTHSTGGEMEPIGEEYKEELKKEKKGDGDKKEEKKKIQLFMKMMIKEILFIWVT